MRALEYTENIQTEDKTATEYMDSRMTLDSLKNGNIKRQHSHIPYRRNKRKLTEMGKISWKINFCWVKAHVGIRGNETANTLAKEVATNEDITECYKKVSKIVVISELEGISDEKW